VGRGRVYCSISSITPSPIKREVIWVGTDDGKVQVTNDRGKTWNDYTLRINGLPHTAQITEINVTEDNSVYVVANNYKLGDNSAYLFRSIDEGNSWQRIVDNSKIDSYLISVLQDKIEPRLLFVGANNGLWISIDRGATFFHWTNDFPAVPVTDMKIQDKEADLVLSTFGRSFWVLDDITPLRQLAEKKEVNTKSFYLFNPLPFRILKKQQNSIVETPYSRIHNEATLNNSVTGANRLGLFEFSFWCNPKLREISNDTVFITIQNLDNKSILSAYPKQLIPTSGFNRVWLNSYSYPTEGTYKVTVKYGLRVESIQFNLVVNDESRSIGSEKPENEVYDLEKIE
jgi:hypothetical protein